MTRFLYRERMNKTAIFLILIVMTALSCGKKYEPLEVVDSLDIKKYAGTWYEIARLPNSFEKGLVCVSATYTLREDGKIKVFNKGHLEDDKAGTKEITGVAWIPDASTPAKLKVRFFWPFAGKYWVLALDNNYRYALVGDPSRKFLWILSRTKVLPEEIIEDLLHLAENNGFNVSAVIRVDQDCI